MNTLRTFGMFACLLAGLSTGCASSGGQAPATGHPAGGQPPATGHVGGRLVMAGGPMGPGGQQPGERPIPGAVTFTAAGRQPVTVAAGPSGAFTVTLPPGRYRVSGRSPSIMTVDGGKSRELPCSQPASATVTAGHTATVTLTCAVP
jgi:hypothetical protein